MRFHVLAEGKAKEMIDLIDPPHYNSPEITTYQANAGAGTLLDDAVIEMLQTQLEALQKEFKDDTKRFDAEACVVIHKVLPHEQELLSNDGFWRWLALGPLLGITRWRFPPSQKRDDESGNEILGRFNRTNFGVGASARQRAECYPYKLWLRAELGHTDDGKESYRYARRGDVDFWTSHVHRQSYTTNRNLCSALVRFQYPDEREGKPYLLSGTEKREEGRLGMRTLAKKLRRLQATYELTMLDVGQLHDLILEQAHSLRRAP